MDNNLKKLQKEWYDKLKAEGFKEIEQGEHSLVAWHSHRFMKSNRDMDIRAKQEYYYLAEHFLNAYPFVDEIDRFIWSKHSEGLSIRDIEAILKSKGVKSINKKVFRTIQKLKKEMVLYGSERD